MAMAIHAWQWPSVGGCAPRLTTQGQKTVQEQFRNNSPLIAHSVGLLCRRFGFGMRWSMRWLIGKRSASAFLLVAMSYPPEKTGQPSTAIPAMIRANPIGFVT